MRSIVASGTPLGFVLSLPRRTLVLLNAEVVLRRTRVLLLYGFAPAVVTLGMMTEPRPSSWFELFNIWA